MVAKAGQKICGNEADCDCEGATSSTDKCGAKIRDTDADEEEILLVEEVIRDHECECLETEKPRDGITDSFFELSFFELFLLDGSLGGLVDAADSLNFLFEGEELRYSRVVGVILRETNLLIVPGANMRKRITA